MNLSPILLLPIIVVTVPAATCYCDPERGSLEGDGSAEHPWGALEEVLQARRIQLCAPDCLAEGNVVANFSADGIRVTRDRQTVQYNRVKNNFARSFNLKADAEVESENNREVTASVFNHRLSTLAGFIDKQFGPVHPTAKRPRLKPRPAQP